MPREYLSMKRKFKQEGLSEKAAKQKAARIYNSRHKKPVGRNYEAKAARKYSQR